MARILLALSLTGTVLYLLGLVVLAIRLTLARRRLVAVRHGLPPVTILKPVKGADEALESNLESFYAQRGVRFQLVVGAADAEDPALAIVRRVAARHPGVPTTIVTSTREIGKNPKVSNLANMLPFAQHEHVLISDANVRVGPDYLARTLLELSRGRHAQVGLVTNPVVGEGERTLGAALENLHLTAFAVPGQVLARTFVRITPVVGKSMLMKREALDAAGGLESVGDVLAEDHVLGQRIREAGYEVRLCAEPVYNVNATTGVRAFLSRHARWMKLRAVLHPFAYLTEIVATPVALALLAVLFGGGQRALVTLALVALARVAIDACATRLARGRWPRACDLWLLPAKDILLFALWPYALVSRSVSWRGTALRIGEGTRVS